MVAKKIVAPVEPENDTLYTLPEVAKICGIHRVTLKRMEDRGLIPKAKWAQKPWPRRVFTHHDMKQVKLAVERYMASKIKADREYVGLRLYVHIKDGPTLKLADQSPPLFGIAEVKGENIDFVSFTIPAASGGQTFEVQIERLEWNAAVLTIEQHLLKLHEAMQEGTGETKQ